MKNKIKIKPLSVNKVWQGRRFKTDAYKTFEQELMFKLPKMEIPEGKLLVEYLFGFSSNACDVDNPIKPTTDVLQKAYGFNDKQIHKLIVSKIKVKKGEEFISFNIEKLDE